MVWKFLESVFSTDEIFDLVRIKVVFLLKIDFAMIFDKW